MNHANLVPTTPSISVVICAYAEGRWENLVRAVESTRAQISAPLETIVVIDHNPRLLEQAAQLVEDGNGVRVLANAELPGLSGARNTGADAAAGEVVAFLDDDAFADSGWLEQLGRHYADPLVLGVGGSVEPVWLAGRPRSFPPEFDWVVGCTYRGHRETMGPVRNLIGANMSFRRHVFREIGGFRSDIGRVGTRPVGCEETEFCIRSTRRWPESLIVFEPSARVWHTVPAARGGWSYFLDRCYSEGLSKAVVRRIAGSPRGLSSERRYVLRALPEGAAHHLATALSERRFDGLTRAIRIVVGLAATVVGYVVGRVRPPVAGEAPLPTADTA
jgi:glycosyltransferase involved in cell wall biosynthesis